MTTQHDFSIIDKSPLISTPKWIGRYQLEYGKIQHADTQYGRVVIKNNLNWLLFGVGDIY